MTHVEHDPAAADSAAGGVADASDPRGGGAPDPGAQAHADPAPASPERELAELREKNLRLIADGRNLATRLQRDKEEALRFAEADFARDLLVVLDDLIRTQQSAAQGADSATLADGVRITTEHFMKLLRSRGVEPIQAEGHPFDPDLHQALMQQPSTDVPAGTVLRELERGYRMHDRVLRAAKVVISTGPSSG
ncbi:MAG: nucleotide exchange factor GrpE [Phycisphaerales bacterium]|nr:nucleotide exchange factor GrpE [Phycisphaerales bacterium]